MKMINFNIFLFVSLILLLCNYYQVQAQTSKSLKVCKPNGKIRGKKPPPGKCNRDNDSECCNEGEYYSTYKCSPTVTSTTQAILTLNGFEKDQDGGSPSECDNRYHSNDIPIVALSTGWYNNGKRCHNYIIVSANNGRSVKAMVVDECDSTLGCDEDHDYQPPCDNNIVDASRAVWKALAVPKNKRGFMNVTWTDIA